MLALFTAMLMAASPGVPENLTPPVGIFSDDDYPADALRNGWEGDVAVSLKVDAAGRAPACLIAQSSGHPSLDSKTCEIMLVRAPFRPALNNRGKPIEDVVPMNVIHWRLPQ